MTDVDRLFAVPLEDFVAERKQVAKELRAAGDRGAAAEVAKLPKPTPPAWALNRLAREEPDAVAEWLAAAAALREASANPGAGLRSAMAEHREATRQLLAAARDRTRPAGRPLSEPMLDRVRDLLAAATADPEQAEALRRGTIVERDDDEAATPALTAAGEDTAAAESPTLTAAGEGGEAASRGSTPARTAAGEGGEAAGRGSTLDRAAAKALKAEQEAERRASEQAERLAELECRVKAAEDALARLRDDATEREAAAAAADERLDEARRTLHRSESEASAAHDAAAEARAAVATAERELRNASS